MYCRVDAVVNSIRFFFGIDNVGDDCPVFDGLFDYCSISAGGIEGDDKDESSSAT